MAPQRTGRLRHNGRSVCAVAAGGRGSVDTFSGLMLEFRIIRGGPRPALRRRNERRPGGYPYSASRPF